jgi:hypothetical protein
MQRARPNGRSILPTPTVGRELDVDCVEDTDCACREAPALSSAKTELTLTMVLLTWAHIAPGVRFATFGLRAGC